MTTADRSEPTDTGSDPSSGSALLATGSVLAAIGATSCCVLPLAFFFLGVSGAWIGNLTALAPYQPYFVAVAVACLAFGFWRVHRSPVACGPDGTCARPLPRRAVKRALWLATILVGVAIVFPYAALLVLSA